MSTSDKEIVAMLAEKLGISITSRDVAYDAAGNLISLNLSRKGLSHVPPELGQLSSLQRLYLHYNQLVTVPPELGQLSSLQRLYLDNNQLVTVPPELGQLSSLQRLDLDYNQLRMVPSELGQLSSLQRLDLDNNQLSMVPVELGQLSSLQRLDLDNNQLSVVPVELGQLSSLQVLNLDNNQLTTVPPELGRLTSLERLSVANNPLRTLPIEIITQGTPAMLSFLRELEESGTTRYEAKLLVVGEGGTGKSSLLRALRNQSFEHSLSTTHGIEVDQLVFPHPQQPQTAITLNTWDFGGQQIYHATHQFFLTGRSVYLVTWNARLGVEQGRLHYWLETIKALAPNAPVLLVVFDIETRAHLAFTK